jgi:3-oxoacyl-(acyl-carrier-protein) synthase/thioesterase domain-containing protein/acyl carrier protein
MDNRIAIVGISGRFAGAKDINSFWENLCQKKESISTFSDEELLQSGISQNQIKSSSYVRARGVLDHVEDFDADFFSIPFMEAQLMDPQHRHFLECCWEAMEDAGYDPERFYGKIGVFGAASRSTYFLNQLYSNPNISQSAPEFLLRTGNENDCLTTRVSYKLNLKGPSLSVQTACSSGLVAVCVACNHLLSRQCDMAIAGAVSIFSPQRSGYLYQKEMIFSPDGHCRPFDANANGTVPGNGVGIIVLKRLANAIEDKDQIYAVILGYASNNDGHEKLGFSAPSIQGQADAIASAIRMAGVGPMTIGYVEAHGTGTAIGDPIEIKALSTAFAGSKPGKKTKCYIGSVKSNIGHLMEASGIAGLIKAVLALKHRKIPPTLHFTKPNPHIDFADSTFYINSELEEWNENPWPRRAGVSAFGFGGTNAHIILEESPNSVSNGSLYSLHILPISAKTPQVLEKLVVQLGEFLQKNPRLSLADIAYTLQKGRKEWKYRKAFVCGDIQEAISLLLNKSSFACISDNQKKMHLDQLAKSWMSGASIDWETLHLLAKPSRISLPTYRFERKRCWIDPLKMPTQEMTAPINCSSVKDSIEEIEEKLITIWQSLLGCNQINRKDNFFDLGGESLLALQILNQIEIIIGVSLTLQSLYQAPTIAQLAQAIFLKTPLYSSNVVQLKNGDRSCPLFMIHPIQGTIFCYEQLIRKINFKGPIFGIQANESSENILTIEEIASAYIQEIKKVQKSGPYLLFGASFGGLVAYEISVQLKKNGDSVSLLGMLDVINPSRAFLKKDTLRDMQTYLLQLFEGKKISTTALNMLSDNELSDRIKISMGLNLLSKGQQEKIMNRINKHLHAILQFEPKSYDGEIIFFEMKEGFSTPLWVTWKDFAKGGIKNIILEGNHLNMLQKPDTLATHLEQYL